MWLREIWIHFSFLPVTVIFRTSWWTVAQGPLCPSDAPGSLSCLHSAEFYCRDWGHTRPHGPQRSGHMGTFPCTNVLLTDCHTGRMRTKRSQSATQLCQWYSFNETHEKTSPWWMEQVATTMYHICPAEIFGLKKKCLFWIVEVLWPPTICP